MVRVSATDDLRAVLHTVTIGALIDWAGESADVDDCREAGEAVATSLSLLDWRTILAEHPTPSSDVTREELADALGDARVENARQADWWDNDEDHALLARVLRAECAPWADAILARYHVTRRDA